MRNLRQGYQREQAILPRTRQHAMTIDILFLAKNRLEFTRESLAALKANTNWSLVRRLELWDDGSADETLNFLLAFRHETEIAGVRIEVIYGGGAGSPAELMNRYVRMTDPAIDPDEHCAADVFAKIDNDTIVPPGWLDKCVAVMEAHPDLDLLGIEPPASRTPHYEGGKSSRAPEFDASSIIGGHYTDGELVDGEYSDKWVPAYASCDSIGGIGLMRTKAFLDNEPLKPHSTYGGFTEWQLEHPRIRKGWIVPPLDVFLLDRLPFAPWSELSKEYESKGWQRAWSKYPKDSTLWKWWTPVGQPQSAERLRSLAPDDSGRRSI